MSWIELWASLKVVEAFIGFGVLGLIVIAIIVMIILGLTEKRK